MQSRQFPTLQEAIDYCSSKGKLKLWGREGSRAEKYVYTLTIGIWIYHLFIHENGLVEITDQTYKRE